MLQRRAGSSRSTWKWGDRITVIDGDGRGKEEAATICSRTSAQSKG